MMTEFLMTGGVSADAGAAVWSWGSGIQESGSERVVGSRTAPPPR